MKNIIVKSGFVFLFVLLCGLGRLSAQSCNYSISNNSGCLYAVTVEFFDASGICDTQGPTNLSNGNVWNLTCGGSCGAIVDVKVTVNGITVGKNHTQDSGSAGPCSGTGVFVLTWGSTNTDITPN